MNFGWNDERGMMEFQRGKEESHDYRYFPDPDLVPVTTDAALLERLGERVGEMPVARQRRFIQDCGMTSKDCEIVLADRATGDLYEAALATGADAKTLTKQFVGIWNSLASAAETTVGGLGIPANTIAELASLVMDGTVSATAAAQVAERICQTRDQAAAPAIDIAREMGLIQERDEGALKAWVEEAFAANPKAIADALGDNKNKAKAAPNFLRGQVMRLSKGKADPRLAGELIDQRLAALRSEPS